MSPKQQRVLTIGLIVIGILAVGFLVSEPFMHSESFAVIAHHLS